MITKRDKLVINYLSAYKCAHTSTLSMFYPSLRVAQRRLQILCADKVVGRCRDNINAEYIYYLTKPKQLRHAVSLTDFLREFSRVADIKSVKPEVTIGSVRADALMGYYQHGKAKIAFIEIQISNAALDVAKYEKLYYSGVWKSKLPEWPLIIAVTDRKIPKTELRVARVSEDLLNIKEVF